MNEVVAYTHIHGKVIHTITYVITQVTRTILVLPNKHYCPDAQPYCELNVHEVGSVTWRLGCGVRPSSDSRLRVQDADEAAQLVRAVAVACSLERPG